jgi:hypothetical protein
MTTDQLTAEQKNASGLASGYFDNHGWGFGWFGVSVVTRRIDLAGSVGMLGLAGTAAWVSPGGQIRKKAWSGS